MDKELYELVASVADQLPLDAREEFAELVTVLTAPQSVDGRTVRRWLRDAGWRT